GVRVLISIRAEDAWQMIQLQESLDYQLSNQNYFKLPKFTVDQAVNVLCILCEKAAMESELDFVHDVVDRELRDQEDGLVSPINLGIIVLVLATGRQAFTRHGFKAYGGIDGLLAAWLDSQLEAARQQGLEKSVVRTLTALCDFERNRRAGILTPEAISNQL